MALPASVAALIENPSVTDIALHILRTALPDVTVVSEIPMDTTFPLVLIRRGQRFSAPRGNERGLASTVVDVNVFTSGLEGDAEAEAISEAIRVAMRDAWANRLALAEGLGSLVRIWPEMAPSRSSDWATASGPVQYADLPAGAWRWESAYRITYRPPR